jgi:AbrB family looped-hinge helix DNA binding protein
MTVPATTEVSSKGQVVIPEAIRKRLGLEPGAEFVVVACNDAVILKAIALTGRFARLDGYQALATVTYKLARGDNLDVSTVTEIVDAVNNLAWTGLGMAACGGHHGCTTAIQSFGTTLARALRKWSEPIFIEVVAASSGNGRKIVEDYRTLQLARTAHGCSMQPISAVYGRELLRANGMSDAEIDRLDAAAMETTGNPFVDLTDEAAAHAVAASTSDAGTVTSADDRGGVDLGVSVPTVVHEDMSSVSRAVLRRRP